MVSNSLFLSFTIKRIYAIDNNFKISKLKKGSRNNQEPFVSYKAIKNFTMKRIERR